jgi:hypothetical protein
MPFHLAAFTGPINTSGVRQTLPPVTDPYLPTNMGGFLLPVPLKIVAAYATAPDTTGGAGTVNGLQNARINAPSLLRIAYPYIRPLSHTLGENSDPNVMNLVHRPLPIPASETVSVEVISGLLNQVPTNPNTAVALLWFCERLMPVPPGENFTLRFATTSPATVPGAWSTIGTMIFDQSLPAGKYTVIGFEHWSPNAIAARLILPGLHVRPGTLSSAGAAPFQANKRPERLFFEGGIGVFGTFDSFAPPLVEVLTAGVSGDTQHETYLTVVRTGDIDHHQQAHGAPGSSSAPGYPGAQAMGAQAMGAQAAGMHHHAGGHHHHAGGRHPHGTHHAGPLTAATPPAPGSPHTF